MYRIEDKKILWEEKRKWREENFEVRKYKRIKEGRWEVKKNNKIKNKNKKSKKERQCTEEMVGKEEKMKERRWRKERMSEENMRVKGGVNRIEGKRREGKVVERE